MRSRCLVAAALAAPLLAACAAPAPPQGTEPADMPPAADIHRCLVRSRQSDPGSLTDGRVVPSRYNACMQRLGWREETLPVSSGPQTAPRAPWVAPRGPQG